jgi:uncharacterized protein YjbI with pentapeptide repeats
MGDNNSNQNLPIELVGPLSSQDLERYFVPRSDLTHRKLQRLTLTEVNLRQSLFTGSLIRDCVFTRVIFERSDLDGLRIERSTFVECDLSSCDYRSIVFADCTFKSCDFNTSFIDDCEFQICELIDCNFSDCSLTRCRFIQSALTTCKVTMATLLHNKLYDSTLSDMVLGNCSLLYFIFRNCTLTKVSINAESIGAIFGLRRDQLEQLQIIYLGEKQAVPAGADIVELISEEYRRRAWYIGQLVIEINFSLAATMTAFESYMQRSHSRFVELGFAKGEELDFLGDVLQELDSLGRLPLLTALDLIEWCTALESEIIQKHAYQRERLEDPLHTFISRITIIANSLLDKLDASIPREVFEEPNRSLCVKAVFNKKPLLPFVNLLNWINSIPALGITERSRVLGASSGSYIEVVYTTLLTIYALKMYLFYVNGCLIQLTEMKVRIDVLLAKKPPKSYLELARSPAQQILPTVKALLPAFAEQAKSLASSDKPLLSGYDITNVESVTEVECPAPDVMTKKPRSSTYNTEQQDN